MKKKSSSHSLDIMILGTSCAGKSVFFGEKLPKSLSRTFFLFYLVRSHTHKQTHCANSTTTALKKFVKTENADGVKTKTKIRLWNLWDQDRFHDIHKEFMNDADGCIIIMYSVDSIASLEQAEHYTAQLCSAKRKYPILLVANKVDLPISEVQVVNWKDAGARLAGEYSKPFLQTRHNNDDDAEKVYAKMVPMISERQTKSSSSNRVEVKRPESDGVSCAIL